MDIKKETIESVINMPNLARWAPGVDALGWTVRVEDGSVRFNCELNTDYITKLANDAATALEAIGYAVAHVSLSMLLVSNRG